MQPPSQPKQPEGETTMRPETPPPSLEPTPLERMKSYLRQPLRISVTDGRIFLGTFAGTDKPLNILLASAEEFKIGAGEMLEGRYVGQVLIPWRIVTKVEAPRVGEGLGRGRSFEEEYMYM